MSNTLSKKTANIGTMDRTMDGVAPILQEVDKLILLVRFLGVGLF